MNTPDLVNCVNLEQGEMENMQKLDTYQIDMIEIPCAIAFKPGVQDKFAEMRQRGHRFVSSSVCLQMLYLILCGISNICRFEKLCFRGLKLSF